MDLLEDWKNNQYKLRLIIEDEKIWGKIRIIIIQVESEFNSSSLTLVDVGGVGLLAGLSALLLLARGSGGLLASLLLLSRGLAGNGGLAAGGGSLGSSLGGHFESKLMKVEKGEKRVDGRETRRERWMDGKERVRETR